MKKLLLLGALAFASLTSNAATVEGYLDRAGWTVTACSQINEGGGSGYVAALYDDNLSTYYHQNWSGDTGRGTHWVMIDMGSEQKIHGVDLWGRQNHVNGHIEKGKIYASTEAFTAFADHDAAKAYYDNDENVPVGTIDYTYEVATRDNVQSMRFDEINARYLLLVTEQTSQNHLCIAEIQVVGNVTSRVDLDRSGWTITACSVRNDEGPIANMIDDNVSTYYHQNWGSDKAQDAYHWLMINFGQEEKVDGFKYWRRQNNATGQFISGKVYVSNTPFTEFATHDGNENAAKTYYEDAANVPAGEFNFTYDKNPDFMRECAFSKTATGQYMLIIVSNAGSNNNGRHLCCAELKVFHNLDDTMAKLLSQWEEGVANLVTRAGYLQALGSYLGKECPSAAMPDDITEANFAEKLAAATSALEEYINSFENQLIYIQHATRRDHAYLAALPTGNGIKLNTIEEPTADAVWQIRFIDGNDGFYLYSRTTNTWISTKDSAPAALTESATMLSSRVVDGHLTLYRDSDAKGFNVDTNGNNLVWYGTSDDGSKWTITSTTLDNQVYVNPQASTAEAPIYYRIVNARWMKNHAASNIAVNGENQNGNGNGELVTRANATIPGIYWRIENSEDGVKLINLTGYELTDPTGKALIKATDNGSTIYLIKQTNDQFHGVNAYAISNAATQGNETCLDVSGNNSKFCWSPSRESNGNDNNGSAWYFILAGEDEVANATATYIAGVKDRMLVGDNSLGELFGQGIYDGYTAYMGDETISELNAAKASGVYPKTNENVNAINAKVNGEIAKLLDRHFLLHNCNSNYSNCYMTVADGTTAPTADASDVNALWSFVPAENGYLMTSAATGHSLSYTTTQSAPIPVVEDGLPYSIAYNANVPGFHFTLVSTDDVEDVSYYSVHQSNNNNVCKWIANNIAGSHWKLETVAVADIKVEQDGEVHSITLPEDVTLNTHASAADHVMTITKQNDGQDEENALLATMARVAPENGVHTISADDFVDNKVQLSGVESGDYKVEAPAGMFLVNGKPAGAINNVFTVADNGSTTGVTEVGNASSDVKVVYDLQGRRVKGNAKGLLIINGKKTLVK